MWSMLKKLTPWAIAGSVMLVVWSLMGATGYRAGNRVGAGSVLVDPELVRLIASAIVGGIGLVIAKLPYSETIQAVWDQIVAKPQPVDPLRLTALEERDQYDRLKGLTTK